MIDLALNKDTHDLYFDNADLTLVNDIDSVEQHLKVRLLFYLREWFLDTTSGVPYFSDVLIKNPNIPDIENIFKSKILDTNDVEEILEFNSTYDPSSRVYSISFKARTKYGEVDLQESLFNN